MGESHKSFLLAGLSGLILALAYPGWPEKFFLWKILTGKGFDLGWLAWIGLIPLFWSLNNFIFKYDRTYKRSGLLKTGFLMGFTAGLTYFLIIFRWFWSIYPLETLGVESNAISVVMVFLVYLVSSAGMAMFYGLFGVVYSLQLTAYSKKSTRLFSIFYFLFSAPALFVLLEYARAWGFGFLWAGSGSLFGPHWTLGNLAYSLADNPLALKLTSFVGIYGVTFVIVFINCLIFKILGKTERTVLKKTVLAAVVTVIVGLLSQLLNYAKSVPATDDKIIDFALVQTAQPTRLVPNSQEMLANTEEQLKLLNQVAKEYPKSDLIVFPETSELFKNIALFMTPVQVKNYFSNLFKEPKLIIAGGRALDTDGKFYSRVFSLDTQNDILNFYDKRLLTPGGEFFPYPIKWLAQLFSKDTLNEFSGLRELSVGGKDISTVNFRDQFKAAPMVCSELLSPELAAKTSQNSDVIASMASYGIFHKNQTIADQMLAATRSRAAEMAKPIITAANLGRSHAVDSRGNVVLRAENASAQILTGRIVINHKKTWYNRMGDIPILLGSLILLTIFELKRRLLKILKS